MLSSFTLSSSAISTLPSKKTSPRKNETQHCQIHVESLFSEVLIIENKTIFVTPKCANSS